MAFITIEIAGKYTYICIHYELKVKSTWIWCHMSLHACIQKVLLSLWIIN